jgi:predicted alpha/beta-fold hydrolase
VANGEINPFEPVVRNPHLLTILGNFWPRKLDTARFPEERRLVQTEPGVQVLVVSQRPHGTPVGQLVMVHGLEGSSNAGYKKSMAQHALEAGFIVHRFNMRGCGGTESFALSNYHAGQTGDLRIVLEGLRTGGPMVLVGFSLGGNVSLKLAGELGETDLIAGVCAVSTPIDLAECVRRLGARSNFIYSWRFLSRLRDRIRLRARQAPDHYSTSELARVRTVHDFDHLYTAQFFGFGSADNYYGTQAAKNFLDRIRVPALLIQAKDDPLIPVEVYDHPAFRTNPNLRLLAVEHGGHLGFIARGPNRFWLDPIVIGWARERVELICPR